MAEFVIDAIDAGSDVEWIELPVGVAPRGRLPVLVEALGLSEGEVTRILDHELALVEGMPVDEEAVRARNLEMSAYTGGEGVARIAPEHVLHRVPIEAARAARLRLPRIPGAIDDVDLLHLRLEPLLARVRRLRELAAPDLLRRAAHLELQQVVDAIAAARAGETAELWQPYDELMTGIPEAPVCREPSPAFARSSLLDLDEAAPSDVALLPTGALVMFPYASVLIARDGELVDVFPTRGLRAVGGSATHSLFVSSGGPTASTGYFSPTPIVRDHGSRRWHVGRLPEGLPRYVAGTVADLKWSIVTDLERGQGFRTSRCFHGDQSGETRSSACNRYVVDGGRFVFETATGRPALDLGEDRLVLSFARGEAWRLVVVPPEEDEVGDEDEEWEPPPARVVDGEGRQVAEVPFGPVDLDPSGRELLHVVGNRLILRELDRHAVLGEADLGPLARCVRPPESPSVEVARAWQDVLATWGLPRTIAAKSEEALIEAIRRRFGRPDDVDINAMRAEASRCPATPKRVPVGS
ncbi:MAG: hypothetical protein AB8I08_15295 [Sandaracinaceae bacterium]